MKKPMGIIMAAVMCLSVSSVWAQQDPYQKLMQRTLDGFWGKAVDSRGRPLEPADDADRTTMPIPEKTARQVIDVGRQSGLSEWCGVPWQDRYFMYMEVMRRKFPDNDKAIAYIGALHGAAQGMTAGSRKNKACPEDMKIKLTNHMQKDIVDLKYAR